MEHLDVLVVGAGLSGIGAGHYLQTECPWASYAIFEARDAIGGTWDLFRYPGIRSDSDMFTLGYSFRPWDGEKSIADGASILQYIKDTAAEDGHRRAHPLPPPHRPRPTGRPTTARWHVTAERTDTGETVELTCGFVFSCSGYYRYDHGYQPDFAGIDRFAGHDRPPAGLARGPRLRRQAGRRHRQRRHRGHAHPVDGRDRRRTSRCSSARRPTSPRCRPRTRRRRCCAGSCPTRWSGPAIRWFKALDDPGLLPAQPAPARAGEEAAAQGRRAPAARGLRRRHPLHAPLRPVGPAAVRRARRRPVQGDQGRHARRSSPTTSTPSPRPGIQLRVGRRARGRHHRHRHRARAAVHRRHRAVGRRRAGRPRRASSPTRG